MGLETKYPELSIITQFYESNEEVQWQLYDAQFSGDFDVLYIYGFSPNIDTLIEWVNKDSKREIVFLEDRIEAIKKIDDNDSSLILEHPQVQFRYYLGDVPLNLFVSEVIRQFPFEKIEVICLHDDLTRFEELKKLLFRKATIESAIHTDLIYSERIAKNLIRNFQKLPEAFHIGLWKDRFKDCPAIVCGAGPSLQAVEGELKGLENKALILAGGSAIAALSAMNITPHLLYAIDPNPEEFTRLAFHTAYNVPLIFGCRLEPDVFYSHAGPVGYLTTGTGGAIEKWMEDKLGIEDYQVLKGLGEEALSITTIAFMNAIYFGCNPIILAGVDLSFDTGKRYSTGVISDLHCSLEEKTDQSGDTVWAEDGLATMTKWFMERDVLDAVCEEHQERVFLKASSKGLSFKNIPFDPNWYLLKDNRDIRGEVFRNVMDTPLNINQADIDDALNIFFKSMGDCKIIVNEIVNELVKLYPNMEGRESTQKSTILEMDLEDEIAFQTVLKSAIYALTFHVKRDHRPSNLPRNLYLIKLNVYKRLQAIIDQYLDLC